MHSPLTDVHAAHDIRRGEKTVVKCGSPGRVLYSHPSWFETTYTVSFTGVGKDHRGVITLIGLNNDDVQPTDPDNAANIVGCRHHFGCGQPEPFNAADAPVIPGP